MAESPAILIKKFDDTGYKSWSLEVEILLEQKKVLSIVDHTEEAPEEATELKSWKTQHGIVWLNILQAMARSLEKQFGIQKDAKALCDRLKEDYKSKVKFNMWALHDEMSAVKLSNCKNVQEYTLRIQSYVNDYNLCANTNSLTGSSTMPKCEHTFPLTKGVPNDDYWRLFTQLMNNNIATLADQLEEAGVKIEAHNVQLQKDDGSEDTAMFQTLWTKSEKQN
jgi:hypothetical protein